LVEVNCETDFVARTEDFQSFAAAMVRQVAAQPNLTSAEALVAAPFIDNSSKTVSEQLTETIAKLGENIIVRRVARFTMAGDGLLDQYIHTGGRVGVLVELAGSQTKHAKFVALAHDLALHIAAASPRYVTAAEVPTDAVEAEKSIYREQLAEDRKPDNIKEKIIEGKLHKWYEEVVLVEQPFVKDNDQTIAQLLEKYGKELGSPVTVQRFARFELGAS
jgi:elongation factor Ts